MVDRLRGMVGHLFKQGPKLPQAYEFGGVLVPTDVAGFIEPPKGHSPRFTEEKQESIRRTVLELLSFYKNSKPISDLPLQYPFGNSRWNTPIYEYRGIIIADLFVASIVNDGRITGGSDPTPKHRRLQSSVKTTSSQEEASGYANRKALSNFEQNYAKILGLDEDQIQALKTIGFFKPVVLEFDRRKMQKDIKDERIRSGTGTKFSYTETTPYLLTSHLSDLCLERLSMSTRVNFLEGKLNN